MGGRGRWGWREASWPRSPKGPIALPEGRTEAITHPLPLPPSPYALQLPPEPQGGALVFGLELDLDTHFSFFWHPFKHRHYCWWGFYSLIIFLPHNITRTLEKRCHPLGFYPFIQHRFVANLGHFHLKSVKFYRNNYSICNYFILVFFKYWVSHLKSRINCFVVFVTDWSEIKPESWHGFMSKNIICHINFTSHTHTHTRTYLQHSSGTCENIIGERGGCMFAWLCVMTACRFPVTSTWVCGSRWREEKYATIFAFVLGSPVCVLCRVWSYFRMCKLWSAPHQMKCSPQGSVCQCPVIGGNQTCVLLSAGGNIYRNVSNDFYH